MFDDALIDLLYQRLNSYFTHEVSDVLLSLLWREFDGLMRGGEAIPKAWDVKDDPASD